MSKLQVLVVEDEEGIRELLHDVLEDAGFIVSEAETGDAGFVFLQTHHPTLLLTDINMPGRLDGLDLAAAARRIYPDLPIVFITARIEFVNRALKIGDPGAVLTKPFRLAEVVDMVRKLADGEPDDDI